MNAPKTMRVLLVEDSATVAAYVASILGAEADMQLIGVATTAQEGVQITRTQKPDVVLMDMKLPDHDGLWAIEQIMAETPVPIVVLSGYLSSRERDITFESLRAGAVDVMAKPTGLGGPAREAFRSSLLSTVRLMSTAVVVRRRKPTQARAAASVPEPPPPERPHFSNSDALSTRRYVLIGASTGGPELIYRTLSGLPKPLPFTLLIAQHTLDGFDESLAQWLACTGHPVVLGRDGLMPMPGTVVLSPADRHMRVTHMGIALMTPKRGEPIASIDTVFESAAKTWGEECLAIVLSGMGRDGAEGMRWLKERGALTVAQSSETCVVASMPESARARGAIQHVLSPEGILALLTELAKVLSA
jgi:two-component system chemotaxis response regulator CheB